MSWLIGIVAPYGTSFVFQSVESLHNPLGIALGHLYIAELRQQVDMTDILPLLHIAVQELHYLTWIEAISLAEVNEQSLVARLRLVLSPSS